MAGITTAAILGATAISAGAGIGSAALASRSAGKAADTQSDAADKALALQREIYQQQRADTLPMLNRANQAGATLSGLMGLPTGPPPGPTGVPDTIGPPPGAIPDQYGRGFGLLKPGVTPEQALDPNFQYTDPRQAAAGAIQRWQGNATGTDPMSARGQALSAVGSAVRPVLNNFQQGQGAPSQTQSSYVQMRAPTGEVQPVPADQVDHYQRMGAVRV